jgi:hypothetical protein
MCHMERTESISAVAVDLANIFKCGSILPNLIIEKQVPVGVFVSICLRVFMIANSYLF